MSKIIGVVAILAGVVAVMTAVLYLESVHKQLDYMSWKYEKSMEARRMLELHCRQKEDY